MATTARISRSAPALAFDRPAERIAGIVAFAALTALGAFVRIPLPFTPVPVTLQSFFVVLAGVYLGGRDGAASQALYVATGLAGLPIFAGGAGLAHLMGPTGGYLVAFPIAAWLVGATLKPGDAAARAVLVLLAAKVVIFALGAAWLAAVAELDAGRAVALGVLPFLPGTALKIAAATGIVVRAPLGR